MSGVCGAARVRSRADYDQFVKSYTQIIARFPGAKNLNSTGSYISDVNKESFGDIDLILNVDRHATKQIIKQDLVHFFTSMSPELIVPFSSEKYAGRRAHNSGEIVTIRYFDKWLGYSVQIDNVIAKSDEEARFKTEFLNMPAEIQGLALGLVKVATLETLPITLCRRLGINPDLHLDVNQEWEFNLSSVELQLRKVTYVANTFTQIRNEIVWKTFDFDKVEQLLASFDFPNYTGNFSSMVEMIKSNLDNPRSPLRIKGIFNSMISVKSGEVGTIKGDDKLRCINIVNSIL